MRQCNFSKVHTVTQAVIYSRYWTLLLPAGLYTYSGALSGLDTDTICVSLGRTNNPSDSILSICAKRTEGGWEAESKRAVGGGGESKEKEEQGC